MLGRAKRIGPKTHAWAEAMLVARGIQGTRVLQGLLSLDQKHPQETLEKACETALSYGAFRLKTIRQLLARSGPRQEPLPLLDEHPLIRPLDDYAQIVARAIHRHDDRPSLGEGFERHGWTEASDVALPPEKTNPDRLAADDRGLAEALPPRSGYPLSGCSSAEPDSVSPDRPTLIPPSLFHQE